MECLEGHAEKCTSVFVILCCDYCSNYKLLVILCTSPLLLLQQWIWYSKEFRPGSSDGYGRGSALCQDLFKTSW